MIFNQLNAYHIISKNIKWKNCSKYYNNDIKLFYRIFYKFLGKISKENLISRLKKENLI